MRQIEPHPLPLMPPPNSLQQSTCSVRPLHTRRSCTEAPSLSTGATPAWIDVISRTAAAAASVVPCTAKHLR